jgi:hypothetical protein
MYYYLPNKGTMNADGAIALGLGYAMNGSSCMNTGMSPGPDGNNGVIFTFDEKSFQGCAGFQWQQLSSGVWVGFGEKPGPDQLARKTQRPGYLIELGDENQWQIPIAIMENGATPFARKLKWDGAEWKQGDIDDRFREIYSHAGRILEILNGDDDEALTFAETAEIATAALALNYRVGPDEISMLGLFDTEKVNLISFALVDWPERIGKKKANFGVENTSLGQEA